MFAFESLSQYRPLNCGLLFIDISVPRIWGPIALLFGLGLGENPLFHTVRHSLPYYERLCNQSKVQETRQYFGGIIYYTKAEELRAYLEEPAIHIIRRAEDGTWLHAKEGGYANTDVTS